MNTVHHVVHSSLTMSGPFVAAVLLLTIGATALALLFARTRRLSARSRYTILSFALFSPAVAAIAVASRLGAAIRGVVSSSQPATDSAVAAVDVVATSAARPATDWTCFLFFAWAAISLLLLTVAMVRSIRWSNVARNGSLVTDPLLLGALMSAAKDCRRLPRLATSPAAVEPMVVGIVQPTVLLPETYLGKGPGAMTPEEIESVLTHELEHVRRRDNFTAAVYELAFAIFWFDPLHWMARRRMLELRERACDERVLDAGCEPDSYLSALAKTCHAAIESPAIACMSGFHIQERMRSIMSHSSNRLLFASEKAVRVVSFLAAAALVLSFVVLAPQPSIASPAKGGYSLHVEIVFLKADVVHLVTTIMTPDGRKLTNEASFNKTQPITIESIDGNKNLRVTIPVAEKGRPAMLDVFEGTTLIEQASVPIQPLWRAEPPAGYSRIEGDVKAPQVLTRVQPLYPEEARKERIVGIVIVEALIDEHGVVRDVRIVKDLPSGLGQAAVDAVRQWTFSPGTLKGKPVAIAMNLTINFKLDSGEKK